MFPRLITLTEPANGINVGTALPGEIIKFPDVSSCLIVIFQLESGVSVGGHVPMMWGSGINGNSFQPKENLENVIENMLRICSSKSELKINQIILVGDKSIWKQPKGEYGSDIAVNVLKSKSLDKIEIAFVDKERWESINIVCKDKTIIFQVEKNKQTIDVNVINTGQLNKLKM